MPSAGVTSSKQVHPTDTAIGAKTPWLEQVEGKDRHDRHDAADRAGNEGSDYLWS
jgi:hypothetical protein